MSKFLIEQLPEIVEEGRPNARLQPREAQWPARDGAAQDREQQQAGIGDGGSAGWTSRLIYGDNLPTMAALLAGDEQTPSLRGKVDQIYIDPPFDSRARHQAWVSLPRVELVQSPAAIELFVYSDARTQGNVAPPLPLPPRGGRAGLAQSRGESEDTASHLATIAPRLILLRDLLADTGSIYVHLAEQTGHEVKPLLDDLFGKDNLINAITWHRDSEHGDVAPDEIHPERPCDTILLYRKTPARYPFDSPRAASLRADAPA